MSWNPYIKPTRKIHDSGYRCFETGYINENDEKVVIGSYTDHVWNFNHKGMPEFINMDLARNGCIRFFSHGEGIKWEDEDCYSTMTLVAGKVSDEVIAKLKLNQK